MKTRCALSLDTLCPCDREDLWMKEIDPCIDHMMQPCILRDTNATVLDRSARYITSLITQCNLLCSTDSEAPQSTNYHRSSEDHQALEGDKLGQYLLFCFQTSCRRCVRRIIDAERFTRSSECRSRNSNRLVCRIMPYHKRRHQRSVSQRAAEC